MASSNPHLNVYRGTDSLKDYFNPDLAPPVPLVEISRILNPFYDDGVRIYAKMMSTLPANNVKALPALNMLQSKNVTPNTKTIIEYSSGSTVISMSMIARVLYGMDDTRAYLSNKTSWAKLQLMRFFGLNITLFGGPSQPEPDDDRGGIRRAQKMAQDNPEVYNPNQYTNGLNWGAHVRWTGPQILRQLPEVNVFCAGMGTAGTMTGIGTYLKKEKPSVTVVGVCTAPGDRVPGPRSHALLAPVEFPWREAIDCYEEVGSVDSYRLSMALSREGLICGPSSGFNLQGLYNYVSRRKSAGTLDTLRGEDGLVHSVFICCDLPYQYLDDYFEKLGEGEFHALRNGELREVDLWRYDEAWELSAETVLENLYSETSAQLEVAKSTLLLDLRTEDDFSTNHLPGATNLALQSLNDLTPSPFFDTQTMVRVWKELESLMKERRGEWQGVEEVVLVCYDGDVARVATSVLRQRGIVAWSLKNGMKGLKTVIPMAVGLGVDTTLGIGLASERSPGLVEVGVLELP